MTQNAALFSPVQMGALDLPNRVLMAPLTRNRAQGDGTPKAMAVPYYRQRASAGLIFTEATQISAMGKGYLDTPGIYTEAQVTAWKKVTDAIHAAGGRVFLQLWHVGRISHSSLLPDGRAPLSASAIRADAQTFTANGFEDCSTPDAMTEVQITQTLAEYRHAAKSAKEAGFDGIEVHAANGYLLDQFLQDGSNHRDDAYGGSIENRMRFLQEVLDVVGEIWSPDRTGVRLSPLGQANDISDTDPETLFAAVIEMLDSRKLAYLHMVEAFPGSTPNDDDSALIDRLRQLWSGFYIANGGYEAQSASDAITSGTADAVTFGRPFIANPDLPERFRIGAKLNEPDADTFYGGDETGYTDYPFMDHPADKVA
ncbi:alkene reductase [Actibacterium sp. 188UL27-1]|uniref:alkene reductase n=1 Tax=Actibacterium sp. 188UL27-1 TaxID=2786961 RepID=UPI00195E65AE|nr:alkene reductase [Actibacterium sp. 188UL27-1]MBM7067656.1 alkene reductase [Actibacterium sp. 188UL27-1]